MTKLMTVPKVFDKVFENRKKGEVLTTSLKVAEVFGIEHKNVLRDIRKLLEKRDKITKLKFELSNKFAEPKSRLSDSLHIYDSVYKDSTGRELPMYVFNKDAFLMLVMRSDDKIKITIEIPKSALKIGGL